jgi:hypothetical protein
MIRAVPRASRYQLICSRQESQPERQGEPVGDPSDPLDRGPGHPTAEERQAVERFRPDLGRRDSEVLTLLG